MKNTTDRIDVSFAKFLSKFGLGMRAKLIIVFLVAKVIPLVVLTIFAWTQIVTLGAHLRDIAVEDSTDALNANAVENIERMTTDTAQMVADFLYARDHDILYLAKVLPTAENYSAFVNSSMGRVVKKGEWQLAADGESWVSVEEPEVPNGGGKSTNVENNDRGGFHYRESDAFDYDWIPLYDEITFVGLDGRELVKVVADKSPKTNYPMNPEKGNVSDKANTYVKAEDYFEKLRALEPGEIYVSDVIGAYVGSNYIGMYAPEIVDAVAEGLGYDIDFDPAAQAYAGLENPNGQRFEGIVRFATPVTDEDGEIIGYVTFALNHDHIMEFVDHKTPMNERYTQLPSAYEGNYAFIWDYNCRSICHPRHHSIVGFDPETGEPQVPWLESSIYDAWQKSDVSNWTEFVQNRPLFHQQSRLKKPAPALTQAGLVGLDGRYLNNAPQCTGWMDLTEDGGSGSFYILWSGLYKLTTAAAIPYYTGQYAPSAENDFSRRGFGIVTIGAGLEDFTRSVVETEEKLTIAIEESRSETFRSLLAITAALILAVVGIAILIALALTRSITKLIDGISHFRAGERQFRFNSPVKDEFGTLADSFDDMADSVVGSVNNPLTITDMERKIIYMNAAGLELCNVTQEDIVGTPYGQVSIYPANSEYDPITALEAGREAEIYFIKERGRYIRGAANYLMDKQGERNGYIIETFDVTDMVLEQIKIEEQRTLLDMIFSHSPDLIWYTDEHGRYITVNPRFASITGKLPSEYVGRTLEEMFPADVVEDFRANRRAAFASSEPFYSEERVMFADGHVETLDAVRTPIFDALGELVGLLGFARNVSVRVAMEDQLRSTQQELEYAVNAANQASEHKGDFLARMSHEIRTPMNAVIGLTNIVQKKMNEIVDAGSEVNREIRPMVDQIEASSQHLLGLLNDILDISKIEAGKIEMSEEAVELQKLFESVAAMIRLRCEEKSITFVTNADVFEHSTFMIDSLRLRQVLINLLGNAVKFTSERGRIEFDMRSLERDGGKTLVRFSVKDNGIGIASDAIETVFQPFEQGDGKVFRKYGGTGLGLAISRNIVRIMGGDIEIESELDKGSTFSFRVWLSEADPAVADDCVTVNMQSLAGKRILLVDDVEINRVIVMSMLEDTGTMTDEASDGVEAIKRFAESAEGTYDIVLMDVQMPNMDGYEAARAIRAMTDRTDAAKVPIIALTANAFKDDIAKAMASGMNAHVAKPVEMETLLATLAKYLV